MTVDVQHVVSVQKYVDWLEIKQIENLFKN